jgi:hypothetical protein
MDSYRKTGIMVGVLFIVATVASILSGFSLDSILGAPNYLTSVSAQGYQIIIAVLFVLIAAITTLAIAFMLFPILRRHIESLALGYVVLRIFENVFYVLSAVSLLVMLSVSQKYVAGAVDASFYTAIGTLLFALQSWAILIGCLIFYGLGSLTLNYVLYKSKLVPRWLSLWGFIGAALAVLYGLRGIFGVCMGYDFGNDILFMLASPYAILGVPIHVQEMVFAIWLIVKGFNPESIARGLQNN